MKSWEALKYLESRGVYMTHDNLLMYAQRGLGRKQKGVYEYTEEALDEFVHARKVLLNQGMLTYRMKCTRTTVERWVKSGMPVVRLYGALYYDEMECLKWCRANGKNLLKYKNRKYGHKTT